MISPGASTKTETTIKLPLAFILFGLGAFVTAQWILFINSDSLTNGIFRLPEIWMGAHFLLLGWIVMVIMGAMYQLVPVAFLTKIWSEKLGFIQFTITSTGIIVFSLLLGFKTSHAVYGAILVIIGIGLFLFQMGMTLKQQQQTTPMTWFVGTGLVCFLVTIVAGLLLVWTMAFGSSFNYTAIFHSHMLLGVAGWFTLLIFGFSYKMVPMFSLSHGFSMKWAKPAFFTYTIGLIALIISFFIQQSSIQTIGWLLLWIGFTFFGLDIIEILKKRIKKKLDRPFTFSMIAIGYGWMIHLVAVLLRIFSIDNQTVWSWLIFLYIVSWVMFSILGYLYKIVPFLWWTHKYSSQVGKKKVPMLKDMIDDQIGIILFITFTVAVIGLTLAGLAQFHFFVALFQGVMLIASLYYMYSIVRVLFK
ncbi:cbb3-type cytochrome c oxidase subunit I [Aquibacillus sediminis]|uniref:cbb3-type cytochrome c oxidase subunit I n=1 Tax=Aquibacillus sediminis TaxID=2574734 RepID=UPI001FE86BCD|nr:cbb3-type cytochrome c oxidase subunit I [Aquibacillus sediminis]